MVQSRFLWKLALSLVLLPTMANAMSLEEQAFLQYAQGRDLAKQDAVLWSTAPCGEQLCYKARIEALPRARAIKNFSQIVGGFGFGVDVHIVHLETVQRRHRRMNVTVLFNPGKPKLNPKQLGKRAGDVISFLRMISNLSSHKTGPNFIPHEIPETTDLHFIRELRWNEDQRSLMATLVSPRKSPQKEEIASSNPCITIQYSKATPTTLIEFPFWLQRALVWKRVCDERPRALQ